VAHMRVQRTACSLSSSTAVVLPSVRAFWVGAPPQKQRGRGSGSI
jgi:hypothetical protein